MRYWLVLGPVLLSLVAFVLPARAQNVPADEFWKRVGPWFIFFKPDFGGCEVINVFAKEKHLRVAYEHFQKTHYMLFAARNGPELPVRETSEVFLQFEPGDRVFVYATGVKVGKSEIWPAMLFRSLPPDVRERLARAKTLRIEYQGEIVADLDLTDLGAAMAEYDACNKARARQPIPREKR